VDLRDWRSGAQQQATSAPAAAQPQSDQPPVAAHPQAAPPVSAAPQPAPEAKQQPGRRTPRTQGDETVLLRRLANSEQPRRTPGVALGTTGSQPAVQPFTSTLPTMPPKDPGPAAPYEPYPVQDEKPKSRGLKILLFTLIGLIVVALIILGIMWALSLNTTATSSGSSGSGGAPVAVASDALISAADLAQVGATGWNEDVSGAEIPTATCMATEPSDVPSERVEKRGFVATDNAEQWATHYVYTYGDDGAAAQAFQARRGQAGTCPGQTLQITGYYDVSSVADEAAAATTYLQDSPAPVYHTLFFSRTGRTISILDVGSPNGLIPPKDLAEAALPVLNRLCAGGEQGTCPGPDQPLVEQVVPPATERPGWLVAADLPRITLGEGVWGAAAPVDSMSDLGTACEPEGFPSIDGAVSQQYATYILGEDPQSPANPLGIDEAIYVFNSPEESSVASEDLNISLTDCQDNKSTATVTVGDSIQGVGLNSVSIAGEVYQVTQDAGDSGTKNYRVAVIIVDNKVAYLMANSASGYDFSEEQWRAIALRAGQRLSQYI
jgi:hypothetical protein